MPKFTEEEEWENVLLAIQELTTSYPEDVIVIGGVAVYFHTINAKLRELPPELTFDADIYVDLPSWGDIKDEYDVIVNRRLDKHEIIVCNAEVDVYLAYNNGLRIDYADLALDAVTLQGVRVASLEDLLLLKLDALADRWRSSHGQKDQRDIAKLLVLLEDTEPNHALALATDNDIDLLDGVLRSSAFIKITDKNAQLASKLRKRANKFLARLKLLRNDD